MTTIPKDFLLPFVKKEKVAFDAYSFYFDRAKRSSTNGDFDFTPGQYVKMFLSVKNPDERGSSHFFTVSSSPLDKEYLVITTRIIQSAFKKTLLELKLGQAIKFFGPLGKFVINTENKNQHVFLAGGIGITPFHSIITYAHQAKVNVPITLFVSFTKVEDCIFYDELRKIAKENPSIKVVYTITHPEESQIQWNGETDRISEELIKKYVPNVQQSIFYIAGPPGMVSAIVELARSIGISEGCIFKENFVGY